MRDEPTIEGQKAKSSSLTQNQSQIEILNGPSLGKIIFKDDQFKIAKEDIRQYINVSKILRPIYKIVYKETCARRPEQPLPCSLAPVSLWMMMMISLWLWVRCVDKSWHANENGMAFGEVDW